LLVLLDPLFSFPVSPSLVKEPWSELGDDWSTAALCFSFFFLVGEVPASNKGRNIGVMRPKSSCSRLWTRVCLVRLAVSGPSFFKSADSTSCGDGDGDGDGGEARFGAETALDNAARLVSLVLVSGIEAAHAIERYSSKS